MPDLLDDSEVLVGRLRDYSVEDLEESMGISRELAELNQQRFRTWKRPFTEENAKPAVLAFQGDVYAGLQAEEFKQADLKFAQSHLRILSGLYGALRPLDLIQPYRLEMGTRLPTDRGKNLYEFWGSRITEILNAALKRQRHKVLVNLASQEYFKAVRPKELDGRILTPVFKQAKGGGYKTIAVHAKKARGLMARFAVVHRIADPEELKNFDWEGYRFHQPLSSEAEWVFTRDSAGK